MLNGLSNTDLGKMIEVFASYPEIEKVIIFGSRVKGNYKPGSDIDLTLIGKGINLDLLNKVTGKLDDLLLPYLMDVSIFSHTKNSELIDHITRVGKPIFERDVRVLHL